MARSSRATGPRGPGAKDGRAHPRSFSDPEKALAVARVVAGESVYGVAKSLGVDPSVVRAWRARLEVTHEQRKDYGALVLRHLELGFAAAERILAQTADSAWLGKQPANDLAVFYGVVFDKLARILSALPAGRAALEDQGGAAGDPDASPP